ncbi:unnamed protein product [Arctia plantaginis]|uniref:THAP-type domain-containing protein n=1 Tax=Arctia plantaginis TaxID=874455 RepID=A0A8S0ZXT1_ARCPL|nr:unnamed protein product [Arctia plantaginis]CAB3238506.1 unnamed protein product [Arctia plantaginis]
MGKCVVKECNSRSQNHNKSSGITFHTIPQDVARREKWIEIIRLLRKETDWLPTKSTIICSKHFREQDKLVPKSNCGRTYLSNKAIPMLFDDSHPEEPVELLVEEHNTDVDIVDTDEEINEIIETQREHKMRKIIHRQVLSAPPSNIISQSNPVLHIPGNQDANTSDHKNDIVRTTFDSS